jgi:hypothetical protein
MRRGWEEVYELVDGWEDRDGCYAGGGWHATWLMLGLVGEELYDMRTGDSIANGSAGRSVIRVSVCNRKGKAWHHRRYERYIPMNGSLLHKQLTDLLQVTQGFHEGELCSMIVYTQFPCPINYMIIHPTHKSIIHVRLAPHHIKQKSMLAPLNTIQRNTLLHELPKWAQLSQKCNSFLNCLQNVINLSLCGETTDAEADTAVCALVAAAESPEHVTGL